MSLEMCVCVCVCCGQRSDLGAVGPRWRRKHALMPEVAQMGGSLRGDRQGQRHRRVLVVRVEAQTLPSVTHVVGESGADRERGACGAVVVMGA